MAAPTMFTRKVANGYPEGRRGDGQSRSVAREGADGAAGSDGKEHPSREGPTGRFAPSLRRNVRGGDRFALRDVNASTSRFHA